jgi:hypothetical protein
MLITVARKPITDNTITGSIELQQTGALHIDACRIPCNESFQRGGIRRTALPGDLRKGKALGMFAPGASTVSKQHPFGRYPTNVILRIGPLPSVLDQDIPVRYYKQIKVNNEQLELEKIP